MNVTPGSFREVLGRFATGVAVVTTTLEDVPYGMTVNSFTSVSLDPPLILFCAIPEGRTVRALRSRGRFGVNLLAEAQGALARRFAGLSGEREEDRFVEVKREAAPGSDVPWLAGCLGWLECQVREVWPAGDHEVILAEVLHLRVGDMASPLLFYAGGWPLLQPGSAAGAAVGKLASEPSA